MVKRVIPSPSGNGAAINKPLNMTGCACSAKKGICWKPPNSGKGSAPLRTSAQHIGGKAELLIGPDRNTGGRRETPALVRKLGAFEPLLRLLNNEIFSGTARSSGVGHFLSRSRDSSAGYRETNRQRRTFYPSPLPESVKSGYRSSSAAVVRNTIRNNFLLLHSLLCWWPWFWPSFSVCDDIVTVYADCNREALVTSSNRLSGGAFP